MSSYGSPRSATGGDVPVCLCRQVKRYPATMPKLAGIKSGIKEESKFLMYCPTCGFKTHVDISLNAVRAEWCGANRPGDEHIQNLWIKRYYEQQNETIPSRQNAAGTMVPM